MLISAGWKLGVYLLGIVLSKCTCEADLYQMETGKYVVLSKCTCCDTDLDNSITTVRS